MLEWRPSEKGPVTNGGQVGSACVPGCGICILDESHSSARRRGDAFGLTAADLDRVAGQLAAEDVAFFVFAHALNDGAQFGFKRV